MTLATALLVFQAAAPTHPVGPAAAAPTAADSGLAHRGGAPAVVAAVRASPAPILDGRLDDPVWRMATPATDFRRDRPGDGLPASERTEVRVAYTSDALYIGARMYTRDPTTISRRRGRRDSFMQQNDQFQVQIDSYHDHRTVFVFGVTPAGGRNDMAAPNDSPRGADSGWDPVWEVATEVDSLGWVAEMRIPFSQLRFREGERQVWGINFRRDILHAGEGVEWNWNPPTVSGWASRFGHLVGLEDVRRPGRVEILPYAVTRASYDQRANPLSPFDDGSVISGSAGLDLKYGLTSGLTLDATVNPDFGQVEADPEVVNLSAYETFLQERRPFFVEGSGLYGFGGLDRQRFFYSRRIGQRPAVSAYGQGTFVDQPTASTILGAAKVSGRTESGWVIGLVNATTQREMARVAQGDGSPFTEAPVDPLSNITALRVRRDLRSGDSYIGAIATGVERDLDAEAFQRLRNRAYTGGVDFLHHLSNRTYRLQGWAGGSYISGSPEAMLRAQYSSVRYFQRPDQDYLTLDPDLTELGGYAGELSFNKVAGEWLFGMEGSVISPGFDMNDAGYQTVADTYALTGRGTRRWVRPGRLFRSGSITLSGSERRNFGNLIYQRGLNLNATGQTVGFHYLRLDARYRFETMNHRSTRGGPTMLDPSSWGGTLTVSSDRRQRISGGMSVTYGGDPEGAWSVTLAPSLSGRGDGWFSWSVRPRYSRSMAPAFFVTQSTDAAADATFGRRYLFAELRRSSINVTLRTDLALTPRLTLQVYAQPFVSTGDYEGFAALEAPRTYSFLHYGEGESTIEQTGDYYSVDADGAGAARTIRIFNPDFRLRSFRSNVVLRWEYVPGSTFFLVWAQDRSDRISDPAFDGVGDLQRLFSDPMRNVLLAKASFWLDF